MKNSDEVKVLINGKRQLSETERRSIDMLDLSDNYKSKVADIFLKEEKSEKRDKILNQVFSFAKKMNMLSIILYMVVTIFLVFIESHRVSESATFLGLNYMTNLIIPISKVLLFSLYVFLMIYLLMLIFNFIGTIKKEEKDILEPFFILGAFIKIKRFTFVILWVSQILLIFALVISSKTFLLIFIPFLILGAHFIKKLQRKMILKELDKYIKK